MRRILPHPEHHIVPYRVGQRVHRVSRFGGLGVSVYPHPAEVVAEARLHEGAGTRVERLARRAKHLVDDVRHRRGFGRVGTLALWIALFGAWGIVGWAGTILWMPLLSGGIINGIGHALGYRNFKTKDRSKNIIPWGIFTLGEELHNNHHAHPSSAKFSFKWWEIDVSWMYIRMLTWVRLARVRPLVLA